MLELAEDEAAIVDLVRRFVDKSVRPVVRDLEHDNTYPRALIDQMKQMGIFGLAVPEPWGGSRGLDGRATRRSPRSWPGGG